VDRIAKPGDEVERGSVLARVHARDQAQADSACARLGAAWTVSADRAETGAFVSPLNAVVE